MTEIESEMRRGSGMRDMTQGDPLKLILGFMFLNLSTEVFAGSVRGLGRSLDLTVLYVLGICGTRIVWIFTVFRMYPTFTTIAWVYPVSWIINLSMVAFMYFREIRTLEKKFSIT